jgi:hypothetical protein
VCDGLTCRYCGLGRIHRPCSSYFNWPERTFLHVAYFCAISPCAPCKVLAREVDPNTGYPGPLTSDPGLRELLAAVRDGHTALAADRAVQGEFPNAGSLVSVYASRERWLSLGLGRRPDGRPLWIGLAEAFTPPPTDHVRVASWTPSSHDPAQRLIELDSRWRPPFRKWLPWQEGSYAPWR